MRSFVLQDWTTIRGGSGTATISQARHAWLDLDDYQDVAFWLQVAEQTGSPTFFYQTSPSSDDSLFVSMGSVTIASLTTMTVKVTQVLMTSATIPLSRFVRWQISGTPTWDATFRLLVAASVPGF